MFLTPPRNAEITFSFIPPIIKTLPRKVISPVIDNKLEIGTFFNTDRIAVVNVTPALGPSFGIPPEGT